MARAKYNTRGLDPRLKTIARNLPKVAAEYGVHAEVTSAVRSYAEQAQLYDDWMNGRSPYPATPPGTSTHELGWAIDVVSDDQDFIAQILTDAGLVYAGAYDPIHFSLPGAVEESARLAAESPYSGEIEEGSPIPYTPAENAWAGVTTVLNQIPIVGPISEWLRGVLF